MWGWVLTMDLVELLDGGVPERVDGRVGRVRMGLDTGGVVEYLCCQSIVWDA